MSSKQEITDADYRSAAMTLGCEEAAIRAIAKVESPRGPFEDDGEPSILFERHVFHRLTNGRFDSLAPDISNPHRGGYGKYSEQHPKLQRAAALDRSAALMSASWGQFQIMGENYRQAGHPTLQSFINAMYRDASSQLRALVDFIRNDRRLLDAIRAKDWERFARIYNGPAYAEHEYDVRIARAYDQIKSSHP